MRFELRRPCADCPFRNDGQGIALSIPRARQIADALTKDGRTFSCHKTVKRDDEGERIAHDKEQHCAGALIMLEREGVAIHNQAVRLAERLRIYDHTKLDMGAPVVASSAEFVRMQLKPRQRRSVAH